MSAFTSEERQLLDDSLQDYIRSKYTFEHFRELTAADEVDGFGRAEWSEYAELGWLGTSLPESADGAGGGLTELCIVMAACGRGLLLEPFLSTIVMGAGAIEKVGTGEQQKILSEVAVGKRLLAFAHVEPDAGYARDYVRTVARPEGEGFVLDGEKGFTLHAQSADTLIVSARVGGDAGPVALFLVPANAEGVHFRPGPAFDGRRGAEISLSGVKVGGDAKLGASDADQTEVISGLIDRGVIAASAEAVGAMTTVAEMTLEYLKSREQFGQPLAKFQVLQHRIVEMNLACEEARVLVHAALEAVDTGSPVAQRMVWNAKVQTAKSARLVGGQAIQLHGGMGMTDELAIGHYYKRLTMCETMYGDGDWYLSQITAKG